MKRAASLLLALLFTVNLLPVTGAAAADVSTIFPSVYTYTGFSDVDENAWYAEYVAVCYETGLMQGKQDGLFDPQGTVTVAEAATVTARVYDLLYGGDGVLDPAPSQDTMVRFFDPDGLQVASLSDAEDWTSGAGVLYLRFSEEVLAALRQREIPIDKLTLVLDYDGQLSLEDPFYQGEYQVITGGTTLESDPWEGYVFDVPTAADPSVYQQLTALDLLRNNTSDLSDKWYQNAQWYFCLHYSVFQDTDYFQITEDLSTRNTLFSYLAAVVPDSLLTVKNSISTLPDTQDKRVLAFYNAGILTGINKYGVFAGENTLTRAELAAMLARLVRPALRMDFSPVRLAVSYSLSPLSSVIDPDSVEQVVRLSQRGVLVAVRDTDSDLLSLWSWSGKQLTKPLYEQIDNFGNDGVAAVKRDGYWGYVDVSGYEVIPCRYEYVTKNHDGVLLAGDGVGKWVVFDALGNVTGTLPAQVNYSTTLGGYIQYRESETGKYGFLRSDGSVAVPAAYTLVYPYSDGYFGVGSGPYNKGFVNENGTVSVPLNYPYLFSGFSEGLAIVGTFGTTTNPLHYDGNYGAVDVDGNEVIPFIYSYLGSFSDGFAPFVRQLDGGGTVAGYVSAGGSERITATSLTGPSAIPASYSCGYALAADSTSGKYGYVNTEGFFAVAAIFSGGTDLTDNTALVQLSGQTYLLTIRG